MKPTRQSIFAERLNFTAGFNVNVCIINGKEKNENVYLLMPIFFVLSLTGLVL